MDRIIDAVRQHGDAFDTPAVVVLAEVLRENIARMQACADGHGVALRPHVKTHKSVDIGRMQLAAGASGITVSDLHQAEVFAADGIDDIFLAFPLWLSAPKAARVRHLLKTVGLKIGLDSRAAVDAIVDRGLAGADRLELVVEVDCGGRRSGVAPAAAGDLARYAADRGLEVAGVFTYPGHGWALGAAEGAAHDQTAALAAAAAGLREVGIEPRIVSAGSTPTFAWSVAPGITEIRPGEYVFFSMDHCDHGICSPDEIALFVATTVVSAGPGNPQIIDVGTMAIGREADDHGHYGRIAGGGGALTRVNEYHGFLELGESPPHPIGTVLPLIPTHSCTAVQNASELLVLEADGTVDRFPVQQLGPMLAARERS